MLISRKVTLNSLENRAKEKCSFHASKNDLARFAQACKLDGYKKFSPVLENLLEQFIEKYKNGDIKTLPFNKRNDRASLSLMCLPELYQTFTEVCKKLDQAPPHVIELLANEYTKQAEKHHGIKIEV